MRRRSSNLAATAVQLLLGAGVLAGGLWLGSRFWGYRAAAQSYDTLRGEVLAPPAASASPAVDFAALTARCPGAVGWLELDDLAISYPVMQAADNDFYLTHSPDGAQSSGGSLFLDAANASLTDTHALIYGHHMQDGSMFGTLKRYEDEAFYRTGSGQFTLYTPEEARRYEIFAVCPAEADDPIYTVGFAHDQAFAAFVQDLKNRALYDTGVAVTETDQVITLSTCATVSGQGRLVVSARYTGPAQ